MTKPQTHRLLIATAMGAVVVAYAYAAGAQIYSTGPGFTMSLEGRYMQNAGDRMRLSPPSTATDNFSSKADTDKNWGGKAALDYRFPSNWDVGVSASGLKSQR